MSGLHEDILAMDLQTDLLHNDDHDHIEIKLRVIESMLLQCTVLVKQSTLTHTVYEEFAKVTYSYGADLLSVSKYNASHCFLNN